MKNELKKAYDLGVKGFFDGKFAPCEDKDVMSMLIGLDLRSSSQVLSSWNKGRKMARDTEPKDSKVWEKYA